MQPRQLGLVFCSKNNNAKQALPDQKDSRELEMSILVMEKGGSSGVTSKKGAENEQGIFTHSFFPSLLFAGQDCLQTWMLWFCPAETESFHVVKRHYAGERHSSEQSRKYRFLRTSHVY